MSISYKVVSKRPGGIAGENSAKYYPSLTNRRKVDLNEISDLITARSTFSRGDVIGVMRSLIDLIPDLLQDGRNVRLDGFGTFSLHASSKGKEDPQKVTSRDITGLKMAFLPDKRIKQKLTQTKFTKVQ